MPSWGGRACAYPKPLLAAPATLTASASHLDPANLPASSSHTQPSPAIASQRTCVCSLDSCKASSYLWFMTAYRQRPARVSTPGELKAWRIALEASQATLGEVLGVSTSCVSTWERGARALPPFLGWALIPAKAHVESSVAVIRRKRRTAINRRCRYRKAQRARAKARAQRVLAREAEQLQRKAVRAAQEQPGKDLRVSLRANERTVDRLIKAGLCRPPGSPPLSFIKPPRARVVRPRKLRSDIGQDHHFRGRPGKKLRPEDIQHETAD